MKTKNDAPGQLRPRDPDGTSPDLFMGTLPGVALRLFQADAARMEAALMAGPSTDPINQPLRAADLADWPAAPGEDAMTAAGSLLTEVGAVSWAAGVTVEPQRRGRMQRLVSRLVPPSTRPRAERLAIRILERLRQPR